MMEEKPALPLPGTGASSADPVEILFRSLRRSRLPLNEQLQQISAAIATHEPHFAEAYDRLVTRLQHSSCGTSAPAVGEIMPGFMLPDDAGRLVSLTGLLQDGPRCAGVFARSLVPLLPPDCRCTGRD
jgi:hypothetical protein